MTNSKSTKRALLVSLLILVMCVSMFVGTTFAWFTDSVTSGVNRIMTGNLDIGVYYAYPSDVVDGDIPADKWQPVSADESLFNENALWEPGYTEAVFLKFENEGSLALQYKLQIDILNEVLGKTKTDADIQLSKYINAYACNCFEWDYKNYLFTERNDATNPAGAPNPYYDTLYNAANGELNTPKNEYPLSMDSWQWLEAEETTYATLVLWMPTTVGNEANHNGTKIPQIDLGISVVATQYTYEEDSFDNQYDADASYPVISNEKLEEDRTEALTVASGDSLTMDMNDNAIKNNVISSGDIVLKNGTINVEKDATENSAGFETNGGSAKLEDVNIKAGSASDYAVILRSTTEMTNVDVTSGGGGIGVVDGAKVTFNSGSVYVDTASTSGRYIFYLEGEGSELTINGGDFSWDPADNQKRAYIYAGAGTTVYVNGGTFGKASTRSGYTAGILGTGTVIIKGGTFGFDPSAWVAEGYAATKNNGTWTVAAQ